MYNQILAIKKGTGSFNPFSEKSEKLPVPRNMIAYRDKDYDMECLYISHQRD